MKPYGQPKKRGCKIHSHDKCKICSNSSDNVIKARQRRKNIIKNYKYI